MPRELGDANAEPLQVPLARPYRALGVGGQHVSEDGVQCCDAQDDEVSERP